MNYLRKNLIFLRKKRNLSRNKVDEFLKRKAGATKRYEDGESEPNISTIIQLAQLYEVSIDDLVFKNLTKDTEKPVDSSKEHDKLEKLYSLLEKTLRINMRLIEKLSDKKNLVT